MQNGTNGKVEPVPKLSKDQCNYTCSGDESQACGGYLTLTIYENKDADVPGAATRMGSASMLSLVVVSSMVLMGLSSL